MAADSQNGHVSNFSVYLGKEAHVPRLNGLSYDVVTKMARPFLKMHRHVFFLIIFSKYQADGRSVGTRHLRVWDRSI